MPVGKGQKKIVKQAGKIVAVVLFSYLCSIVVTDKKWSFKAIGPLQQGAFFITGCTPVPLCPQTEWSFSFSLLSFLRRQC